MSSLLLPTQDKAGGAPFLARMRDARAFGDGYFREVLSAIPAPVYTTDAEGRITYYNEAAAELWGVRPELGKSEWCGSWKLFWPDGTPLPHDECPMALALKERRSIRGMEAIAERPDGTRIPFIPFPTPLFDQAGELIGGVNMLVDITDRKRAELDGQRLAAIIESSDDAIVSKDLNGIITSWNRSAERLFGYSTEEIVGKSIMTLIPSDRSSEEHEILTRIRHGERIAHYETVRRRKDGSLVDISLTVSPIKDGRGKVVGVSKVARDITKQRKAQEQQTLILGEMTHRIKNTLATVQAIASQTLKSASSEDRSAFIARLHALANAHEILTAESWDKALLPHIVTGALKPFRETFGGRILSEGPRDICIDAKKSLLLTMALHELATNSVKYGALSNGTGNVHISWGVAQPNGENGFTLSWRENGGPLVSAPKHRGFGSLLLERVVGGELGAAHLEYDPKGVVCTLEMKP